MVIPLMLHGGFLIKLVYAFVELRQVDGKAIRPRRAMVLAHLHVVS